MYDDFSFDNKYGQEKFVELSACVCVNVFDLHFLNRTKNKQKKELVENHNHKCC